MLPWTPASARVPGPGPYHPGPGVERLQRTPGNFQLRWSMQYECSSFLQNILTKPARHMPSSSCSNNSERSSGSQSTHISGGCVSSEDGSEEASSEAGEQGSQSDGSAGSPSQLVVAPPPSSHDSSSSSSGESDSPSSEGSSTKSDEQAARPQSKKIPKVLESRAEHLARHTDSAIRAKCPRCQCRPR